VVKRQRERGMRVSEGEYCALLQLQPQQTALPLGLPEMEKGARCSLCENERLLWVVASSHDANIANQCGFGR
jgi:hypothetical protein